MKKEKLDFLLNLFPMFGVYHQRYFTSLDLIDKEKSLILDIGCGDGGMTKFLTRCEKRVIAVDIKKSRRDFPYVIADAERLPFKGKVFDQVLCLDAIEHIPHDTLVAKEITRTLKTNGSLVITVPSKFWKFPSHSFMKVLTPSEKSLLKFFGHIRKGYDIPQLKKLFAKFKIEEERYYVSKSSALFFDLEYSNLFLIKNVLLRILAPFLYLNFKLSNKNWGTFLGLRLTKLK